MTCGAVLCREESDKEINIQARMPAWTKGKSVMLDLDNDHIRLAIREEEDNPIIEVSNKSRTNQGQIKDKTRINQGQIQDISGFSLHPPLGRMYAFPHRALIFSTVQCSTL